MTPDTPAEATLRALFASHEHLADPAAPARLARYARTAVPTPRRLRRMVTAGVAAATLLTVGGLSVVGLINLLHGEVAPATVKHTSPSQADPLHTVMTAYEEALRTAQPPALRVIGPIETRPTGGAFDSDGHKAAVAAGLVIASGDLPTARPQDGVVRWAGGWSATTPVMSATETLREMQQGTGLACTRCTAVVITGASLSMQTIMTTDGPASVPAWEFTIRDSASRFARVAVPPSSIVRPPPAPDSPGGPWAQSARVSADGRQLTLTFTGAYQPATHPCGADYTVTHAESEQAVAVFLVEQRPIRGTAGATPSIAACFDTGHERTVTVPLDEPFGDRVLLDARGRQPVPVQRN